jgi:hypothetical protein
VDITVKAALRYLIASSGFANCAAAGIARHTAKVDISKLSVFFMGISFFKNE